MLAYDFGPQHPLRPERLRRTIALVNAVLPKLKVTDPGPGQVEDVLRVHEDAYVALVQAASCGELVDKQALDEAGFSSADTPVFSGMYEASLAYCSGTAAAAHDVKRGAPLAINISGGLHHARRTQASGFCIFNDPAIAISIMRESFDRVAYVDIDVHHGDGVQWIFYDDPNVLTCSIHQSGRTLYPGTGFIEEHGEFYTSINVPLVPHTTGGVWLDAFIRGILAALTQFRPQAIVLQMGTDAHFLDPLASLQVSAQHWCEAVRRIRDFGVPVVALGGGGYCPTTVPRMWTAAILTLLGERVLETLPEPMAGEWEMPKFFDSEDLIPADSGREEADRVIKSLETNVIPLIGRSA